MYTESTLYLLINPYTTDRKSYYLLYFFLFYCRYLQTDLPVVANFWIDSYTRLNCITFERCHGFVLTFCLHSGHRKVCFESFRSHCEQQLKKLQSTLLRAGFFNNAASWLMMVVLVWCTTDTFATLPVVIYFCLEPPSVYSLSSQTRF